MGKGLSPRIRVSAPTGATITGTLGGDTVSFVEKSTGVYEADVEKLGPWTVSGTRGAVTESTVVSVDDVGLFEGEEMSFISTTLNDNDWATISTISQAGTGANYWSVGDTKEITLNGTIGTKAYSNVELKVFILHFNHPQNGVADNNIIFGGFKNASGVDVCLDDSYYAYYAKYDGTKYFQYCHWGPSSYGKNYGGWKGSELRYDILGAVETAPSGYGSANSSTSRTGYDATNAAITSPKSNTLMAALPATLRNVLRLWTRYIDAVGNSSNVNANIKPTVDAGISLLTEFEVQGARTYANQYEQNHQTQMAYYTAGNSKIKKKQSDGSAAALWWLASPHYGKDDYFCAVGTSGGASGSFASHSVGIAPAFKV